MFSFTLGNVPSAFAGPAPFDAGRTPIPPSNFARKALPCALTSPIAVTRVNRTAAAVVFTISNTSPLSQSDLDGRAGAVDVF
jgi:hypothetical protein